MEKENVKQYRKAISNLRNFLKEKFLERYHAIQDNEENEVEYELVTVLHKLFSKL